MQSVFQSGPQPDSLAPPPQVPYLQTVTSTGATFEQTAKVGNSLCLGQTIQDQKKIGQTARKKGRSSGVISLMLATGLTSRREWHAAHTD